MTFITGKLTQKDIQSLTKKNIIRLGTSPSSSNLEILSHILQTTKTLQTLQIDNTPTTFQNPQFLTALAQNTTIRFLNLRQSQCDDNGAIALSGILKENCTIQTISLNENQIGDEGARALANGLRVNCAVRRVYLNGNCVGVEGARALMDVKRSGASLQIISLRRNNFSEEEGKEFVDLLFTSHFKQSFCNILSNVITMTPAADSSKRRRLLDDAFPVAKCLSDLPSGILSRTANYLAAPSRALFAAALSTNRNAVASDERNIAIVGNEWNTLDFGDIEVDLARRLSDCNIQNVLLCIDAVNQLKTLKLTNCTRITGAGLEPLRGSTTIEQIDLSLVGKNQRPLLEPDPPISCDRVLPILDSIIERGEACSLKHLHFPLWGEERESAQFELFIQRYDALLLSRGAVNCDKCNTSIPPQDESWFHNHYRASQKYTCYECQKNYCANCEDDNGDYYILTRCGNCERHLCIKCQEKEYCSCCHSYICVDCEELQQCSECDDFVCKDCYAEGESGWNFCGGFLCERNFCPHCDMRCGVHHCDGCDKGHCDFCESISIIECNDCGVAFCDDCNVKKETLDAVYRCEICGYCKCGKCLADMLCQHVEADEICAGCINRAGHLLFSGAEEREN